MSKPALPSPKAPARKGRGGRPSAGDAAKIESRILDAARDLFFEQGYGAFSIETLAQRAHISKRTFYARFKDKADVFRAVVHRLIEALRPPKGAAPPEEKNLEAALQNVATLMLRASLSRHIISLQRLLLGEATRFPELARAMDDEGARAEAISHISALLQREARQKGYRLEDPAFAAEQFIVLTISAPQRRAMGLGKPFTERELKDWPEKAVRLFLNGLWNE
ncbi:MAG TPA: TetR/AcrR family transcriptional regulator [Alphaproteobacteria bacterium]|nr:TetR/AcrR family transcriptional regulator [Alphaproteobacteria bacterium]